ncbi:MAG TPA: DUF2784 domain-containing protein [Steroidobacteraceae bacterium]|jgi:hypothetical protein
MKLALAADAVMLVHLLFIAFALFGSLLLLEWPRLIWLHIPAFAWGVWIEISGRICPLTGIENKYRALAGESTYGEGFITHYLGPIIYPANFTRGWAFFALGVLLTVNLIGYGLYFRQRRRRRAAATA